MYDELIKRLRREAVYLPEKFSKNAELLDVLMKAANAIELLQKTQQPKWIPVSERLPEKEDMVIFHYAWTGRTDTVYKEVALETLAELEYVGSKPLAWMPLPTPPKGESV